MNQLQLFKKEFDHYIQQYLEQKIKNITRYTKDPFIISYVSYIKTIVLSAGKRIRPYASYLMYQSLGGKEVEKILRFLVSIELFHSFCLIHDDIMDKANLRHNVSTVHKYVTDLLKKKKRLNELSRTGNSQAILIGDLLFSWSQEILNLNKEFDQKITDNVKKIFYEMVYEVTVGQMIDVDITTRKRISKKLLDQKTYLKTAGYSFIKPLQIGAALAGKNTKKVEKFCKELGLSMGIAFQIQDDLFDITSNEKQLQKTMSLDKSQNQHTHFTHFKSLDAGKEIIEKNFSEAKNLVRKFSIKQGAKKKLLNLIDLVQTRTF